MGGRVEAQPARLAFRPTGRIDGYGGRQEAMRVAALYDIHGNLPALEAVLGEVREADVDRVVVGGDVVPGPMPREAIAALLALDLPVQCIRGNGERWVLARRSGEESDAVPEQAREVIRWVAERLAPDEARELASWPPLLTLEIAGLGRVVFCHATPRSDSELFTRLTPEERLRPVFEPSRAAVVVCGHTHMPFERRIGNVGVVNAGSVGMPFGEPGAHWLLLGPGIEPRRTRYDREEAARRVRATEYPQAEAFAAANILQTPSEAEMLELFESQALRS